MRIVYMGSPDFAVPALDRLCAAGLAPVAVITQPDRPRHRGKLTPTPVKARALELGIPVHEPEKIKSAAGVQLLNSLRPDLLAVVAYGQLLSEEILALPPLGAVNIHGSLLPAYRGAAPIHWAVINGERQTGVTTMYLDRGMDTGNLILSAATLIGENETTGELHDRLALLGAELLLATLTRIMDGTAPSIPQREEDATYAPLLKPEDEQIDWQLSAQQVHNRIRGLNPWPGAYTLLDGKRLKLWQSRLGVPPLLAPAGAPGEIIACLPDGVWVRTDQGALRLTEVQPEGKGRMRAADFARGYHLAPGRRLG